eukprot:TRINITY_DN2256_c0_g2_i1.p1 TRINITY_DN2256_c0_g2~~TRINITY_DN2256_c0_g2_i1.p1  ORF type:complete len:127 (+),score=2.09 TRINITY_DN2256_c0_g2_i1:48-383(+)
MSDAERDSKRRKLDEADSAGDREGSPDAAVGTDAVQSTMSPSPTRASPSPNRTPRAPNTVDTAERSRPPSISPRKEISPVRVPYSYPCDSRSNAPERASIDLPPIDSVEEA